jgi:phosphatidylglycerophosphatase A
MSSAEVPYENFSYELSTTRGSFLSVFFENALGRIHIARGINSLNLQSFLLLAIFSLLPGMASAFSVEFLSVERPDVIIPIVLLMEIPFAIWISGFLGSDDRKTIKATFSTILSHDFSGMTADEIVGTIFWGENSITMFILRIWLGVMAAMLCTLCFGKIEPTLIHNMNMSPMMLLLISFSLFSYIFIRNLCEETFRDQIGHAFLSAVFSGLIFAGIYYLL